MLSARPTAPDDPLTDDALTGGYRVWQRKRGHRYSLDDVATAHRAILEKPDAHRALDLGCGIGSVLLMTASALDSVELVGVEAQEISIALAAKNVERNGEASRIRLVNGDFRDAALSAEIGGPFDLITATPPYQPPGTATPSPDAQRTFCRIEMRGGVEAYLIAAGRFLAEGGRVVICADARRPERVLEGARAASLTPLSRQDFIPRAAKKGPLFSVWTLAHRSEDAPPFEHLPSFVARNANGERSEAYFALRAFFGLPRRERDRGKRA